MQLSITALCYHYLTQHLYDFTVNRVSVKEANDIVFNIVVICDCWYIRLSN
jgi:hypothetical protein